MCEKVHPNEIRSFESRAKIVFVPGAFTIFFSGAYIIIDDIAFWRKLTYKDIKVTLNANGLYIKGKVDL